MREPLRVGSAWRQAIGENARMSSVVADAVAACSVMSKSRHLRLMMLSATAISWVCLLYGHLRQLLQIRRLINLLH